MKVQTIVTIFGLLLCSVTIAAQHSLRKETSLPRSGDEYVKTEMQFFLVENPQDKNRKDKETKKTKKNWNFQKLKEKEKKKIYNLKINIGGKIYESTVEENLPDYTVSYSDGKTGEILDSENQQFTQIRLTGDSLVISGYESPGIRVKYAKPQLIMKFPMELSAEYTNDFSGRGIKDSRLSAIHFGDITTTIDEFGEMILPRGDTLTSVVRVHERKEENIYYEPLTGLFDIDAPVNRDSLEKIGEPVDKIITDTYRWYEEGYRYPIFETVQSYRILKDRTLPFRETTCIYAPYEQEFLQQDPVNEKIKKEKKEKKEKLNNGNNGNNGQKDSPQPIEYSFYPNPVKDVLYLKFKIQKAAETLVCLYELSGREVLRKTYPVGSGNMNETLPMSSCPAGTYILRISCGNEYAAEQIIKQ